MGEGRRAQNIPGSGVVVVTAQWRQNLRGHLFPDGGVLLLGPEKVTFKARFGKRVAAAAGSWSEL